MAVGGRHPRHPMVDSPRPGRRTGVSPGLRLPRGLERRPPGRRTMNILPTPLAGLSVVEPASFHDSRGFFAELYQYERYRQAGIEDEFVQDNHARSTRGVLRGLHFRIRRPQAQLVTVIRGAVFDVAVDLRRGSSTFGQWFGTELNETGRRQMYMAPGFAH